VASQPGWITAERRPRRNFTGTLTQALEERLVRLPRYSQDFREQLNDALTVTPDVALLGQLGAHAGVLSPRHPFRPLLCLRHIYLVARRWIPTRPEGR
jgi:hypothetical protein